MTYRIRTRTWTPVAAALAFAAGPALAAFQDLTEQLWIEEM